MELTKIVESNPSYLFDYLVNIFLVYKKARLATLLETANILGKSPSPDADINKMIQFAHSLGLVSTEESKSCKRYLITWPETMADYLEEINTEKNQDIILGKYLGFFCLGHDYSNRFLDRVVVSTITKYKEFVSETTFVCEKSKVNIMDLYEKNEEKIQKMRAVLPPEFTVENLIELDDSILTRIKAIEQSNFQYMRKNIGDYVNDIFNDWIEGTKMEKLFSEAVENKELFQNYKNLFLYFWEEVILKEISLDHTGDEFRKIVFYIENSLDILANADREIIRDVFSKGISSSQL